MPGVYWTGAALAAGLSVPLFVLASFSGPLLRLAGEPPALVGDVVAYLNVLRWAAPAGLLGIGLMRVFLPAAGLERALLWVIPSTVGLNLLLNRVLIWGVAWGGVSIPGFGMCGSAAATAVSLWVVALALLALLHGRAAWRGLVVPYPPAAATLRTLLVIGLPVGATVLVEVTMFLGVSFLAGTMGETVLAAHMIALSAASVSFMIPFAISQAANVRVASALGAGRPEEARRAGLAAMGVTACLMVVIGLGILCVPRFIAGLYVDTGTAAGAAAVTVTASLLRIAAMFQVADGLQTVGAGALRGMHDTRVPMLLAGLGYWVVGFPASWVLGIWLGRGVQGLWYGLFAGLLVVAVAMCWRFAIESRVQSTFAER